MMLLGPAADGVRGKRGSVRVTGFTDSQVAASVLRRGISTCFPICCVAMEMAAQLEARDAELVLEWTPREQNAEADALADGRCDGFAAERRVAADFSGMPWKVLPDLLREGAAFYDAGRARDSACTSAHEPGAPRKRRKEASLRAREPW